MSNQWVGYNMSTFVLMVTKYSSDAGWEPMFFSRLDPIMKKLVVGGNEAREVGSMALRNPTR